GLTVGLRRPHSPQASVLPSLWGTAASRAFIAAGGGTTALLSLDPTRSPRRGLRIVGMLALAALALGWLVDVLQAGPAVLWQRLDPAHGILCARKIVELSLPAVLALGLFARRGAPVDARGTAWAVGIAAAAFGALAFALACPFDDPLYVAVWYSAACGVVTLVTRLVLPPLTRW
ncbi:NrsF family protein, partial [Gluconobacter oxydans]|uniref:NrsF family protein n=1 Tax=Gluconobacter oxydans TaxID=442 RepID=UPI0039E9F60D